MYLFLAYSLYTISINNEKYGTTILISTIYNATPFFPFLPIIATLQSN